MNNLELADKLQATAAQHYGDLCGMLWDGGAALRKLHTENTALRVTEENLRAINAELVEALKEISTDYADRFDLESPSTNPGIKSSIAQARAALAKAEGGEL